MLRLDSIHKRFTTGLILITLGTMLFFSSVRLSCSRLLMGRSTSKKTEE